MRPRLNDARWRDTTPRAGEPPLAPDDSEQRPYCGVCEVVGLMLASWTVVLGLWIAVGVVRKLTGLW